jgi:hypothetical protein
MAEAPATLRRILHFRIRTPGMDAGQLLAMVKPAIPIFQAWGGGQVRLLRNVDDPAQFLQVIEYEAHEALELNRQRIAGDPMLRTYLQTWRTLLQGAVDVDVYEDVTDDAV